MAEEGERFIHVRDEPLGGSPNQWTDICESGFIQPIAPTGKLDRTDIYGWRQSLLPITVDDRSAPCVGETEETYTGVGTDLSMGEP